MKKQIGVLLLFAASAGCMTNHYEEYYVSNDSSYYDSLKAVENADQQVTLKIATSEEDVINIIENGYLPIGASSFKSAYNGMTCAVDTAEKHGAQLILFDIKFKETKNYISVLFLPSTSTSYTHGTVNVTAYAVGRPAYYWSVWRSIEYNIVRSTVNDLTREHIRRYLDPSSVELTNSEDVGASDAQP